MKIRYTVHVYRQPAESVWVRERGIHYGLGTIKHYGDSSSGWTGLATKEEILERLVSRLKSWTIYDGIVEREPNPITRKNTEVKVDSDVDVVTETDVWAIIQEHMGKPTLEAFF